MGDLIRAISSTRWRSVCRSAGKARMVDGCTCVPLPRHAGLARTPANGESSCSPGCGILPPSHFLPPEGPLPSHIQKSPGGTTVAKLAINGGEPLLSERLGVEWPLHDET